MMPINVHCRMAFAFICFAALATTQGAMAITAGLARKCAAQADNTFPLRVPGNPAAGREHGSAKEVREYFNKCVANKGQMDEQPLEPGNHIQTPNEGSDDTGGDAPPKRSTFPDGLI
jgi:hypothetical protein